MSSPQEWVFDTLKTFCINSMRKVQTNAKSARSNKKNENLSMFKIGFSRRNRSPFHYQ